MKSFKVIVSINVDAMWFDKECSNAAETYDAVKRIVTDRKILYPNLDESLSHFMEIIIAIFNGTAKDYSNNTFKITPA